MAAAQKKTPPVETPTALVPLDHARQSLAFQDTAAALLDLSKRSVNIVTITNKAGLQECKAARLALRDARVAVEKRGKDARADFLAMQKAVIGVEAELIAIIAPEEKRLADLEADAIARQQAAIAAAQEKEAARQREISERFAFIRGLVPQAIGATVEAIDALLVQAEAFSSEGLPEDMLAAANYERGVSINSLKAARDARVQHDADQVRLAADQAELAQLRAANEERRLREEAEAEFAQAWTDAHAEEQSRNAAFGRLWEEAHAADRDRTQRLANEAEALRLREEAERLEVERRSEAANKRQMAIDNATLRSAAQEALELLLSIQPGSIVVAKLQKALSRDDEFAGYPVPLS